MVPVVGIGGGVGGGHRWPPQHCCPTSHIAGFAYITCEQITKYGSI